MRALKKSVKLLVYCQTEFLVRYFNNCKNFSNQNEELKTIFKELQKHNYLFKYINCTRDAAYYDKPQDERLIIQELKPKVRQYSYSKREDIEAIESIEYGDMFKVENS